jgi:hypothetical protein
MCGRTLFDRIERLRIERRRARAGRGAGLVASAQPKGVVNGAEVRRKTERLRTALALVAMVASVGPAAAAKIQKTVCGNGIAETGEACDGKDLRSKTCESVGFTAGTLACTSGCALDTGACTSVRYVDNGDGTVTDNVTKLQWEKKDAADGVVDYSNPHDVDNTYTWGNLAGCTYVGCPNGTAFSDFLGQLNYCVSDGTTTDVPGFAGHCDWRLPTIEELETLYEPTAPTCGGGPCIDPTLMPAPLLDLSATTSNFAPILGEFVLIYYPWTGKPHALGKSNPFGLVRAVRRAS